MSQKQIKKAKVVNKEFMTSDYILTPEGYEKLKIELAELKDTRRPAAISRIAEALKLGDLKENAEYHDAKDAQGWLEGRIREIEILLRDAKIIEKKSSD